MGLSSGLVGSSKGQVVYFSRVLGSSSCLMVSFWGLVELSSGLVGLSSILAGSN